MSDSLTDFMDKKAIANVLEQIAKHGGFSLALNCNRDVSMPV